MIEYATLDGVVLQDLSTDQNVRTAQVVGLSGFSSVRGDPIDRPENNGSVEPANQYLPARVSAWDIVITGATVAEMRANWSTLARTLNAARKQRKQLRWRWLGDTIAFQANVRVAGMTPPTFSPDTNGRVMAQILLRAADPINYDQAASTVATGAPSVSIQGMTWPVVWPIPWALVASGSGTVNVTNDGDESAWPAIDIAGPINSPVVQNQSSGKALYFDGLTLALGETLSVDTNPASRGASVAGVSKLSTIRPSASEFFSVDAGSTESIAFTGTGTDGNTTMTVSLRSAYTT